VTYIDQIISLLELKKDSRDCEALNCYAFLNLYGIIVDKNEELAKILFGRAIAYGD
jgi:hypothetical protein